MAQDERIERAFIAAPQRLDKVRFDVEWAKSGP
jgi:hypothetical protein